MNLSVVLPIQFYAIVIFIIGIILLDVNRRIPIVSNDCTGIQFIGLRLIQMALFIWLWITSYCYRNWILHRVAWGGYFFGSHGRRLFVCIKCKLIFIKYGLNITIFTLIDKPILYTICLLYIYVYICYKYLYCCTITHTLTYY